MRALMVDARKGSVFEHDVVLIAHHRRRRVRAFGDSPRTRALTHRLPVDDRGLPAAKLHRHFAHFQEPQLRNGAARRSVRC